MGATSVRQAALTHPHPNPPLKRRKRVAPHSSLATRHSPLATRHSSRATSHRYSAVTTRFFPCSFAWYMALSARASTAS